MNVSTILFSDWGLVLLLILALIIGSFINMVVYRLPKMLYQDWYQQCQIFLKEHSNTDQKPVNLCLPASHCPHCKTPLKLWHNIPLMGYLLQRGHCQACQQKISLRYPIVEIISVIIAIIAFYQFGWTWLLAAALIFSWTLLTLTVIDIDTMLLPDEITLSLIWIGLLVNTQAWFTDINSAIYGALAGYLILWIIGKGFSLITGRDGIGYGDYKLLAAIGAWLGWQALIPVLLLSSFVGAIVGLVLIMCRKIHRQQPIPFGPYLAAAGWICLIKGKVLMQWWL